MSHRSHDRTRRSGVVGRCVAPCALVLLPVGCRSPPAASVPAGALAKAVASTAPASVAVVSVDERDGDFPRRVVFDATGSSLGEGNPTYEWSFGDGEVTRDGPTTVHTYIGAGEFVARLTLTDARGRVATAEVTIDLSAPDCPDDAPPLTLGDVDDALEDLSGIAASRIVPGVVWAHQDSDADQILALDLAGRTLSEHELATPMEDCEDIAAVVDPATGTPLLFLADIGDNDEERDEVALWILEEPDPFADGAVDPGKVRLTYPDGPVDAETLLVDPFTLDAFVVTKDGDHDTEVFVKRAPHVEGGPFVLEPLGPFDTLEFQATGGDVSADGLEVVVRGYGETVRLWTRDGYRPLEEVFAEEPCSVDIPEEEQGEAVTFTIDGRGLVTASEGDGEPVYFIGI